RRPPRGGAAPRPAHPPARGDARRGGGSRNGRAALSDVHGTWLVAIVSGGLSSTDRFLVELLEVFAEGAVVVGPLAGSLSAAHHSAIEAIAGMNAVAGWSTAPRPVAA